PRSARIASTSGPTAPVAPTTATRGSGMRRPALGQFQLDLERVVQRQHRLVHLVAGDHAGHLDRGGGDHAHVDAVIGEGLKHARGHTRMALHAGADHADLAGGVVHAPVQPQITAEPLDGVGHQRQVVARDRERDIGVAVGDGVLDDRVDVDAGGGHGIEDAGRVPGLSGTSVSVTYASSTVWVMPEMIASSMLGSSRIHVPSVPEKVERTWIGTPWLRANSTDRSCSTRAPEPAISSISSGDTLASLRASGTIRGSAV